MLSSKPIVNVRLTVDASIDVDSSLFWFHSKSNLV